MNQLTLLHATGLGLQVLMVMVLVWAVVRSLIEWRHDTRWARHFRANVKAQRREDEA